MSIQAVAWALEQDLPARPKLVLVSIANHADHRTGYCWLKADTIAEEASCTPRGVYNFVGDLVRNGFIRKQLRKGDDGKQRATDYWILFDRPAGSEWNKERPVSEPEADDPEDDAPAEPPISCEPSEPGSYGEAALDAPDEPLDIPAGSYGPPERACIRKESIDEPSKTNPKKSEPANRFAAPPRRYVAPPIAPDIQGDLHPEASKPIFVRCGTRAWEAWLDHKLRTTGIRSCPTTTITIDGERRTGWSFPRLFPLDHQQESESSEEGSGVDPPRNKPA